MAFEAFVYNACVRNRTETKRLSQFNEEPGIIPGCPGDACVTVMETA